MSAQKRLAILAALAVLAIGLSRAYYEIEASRLLRERELSPEPPSFSAQVYNAIARDTGLGDRDQVGVTGRTWERAPAACRRLLDSLGIVSFQSDKLQDSLVLGLLLERPPCGMRIDAPRLGVDLIPLEDRASSLRGVLLVVLLSAAIVLTHSNVGWRRMAILAGAVSMFGTFWHSAQDGLAVAQSLADSFVVAAGLAAIVVLLREGARWVRAGFQLAEVREVERSRVGLRRSALFVGGVAMLGAFVYGTLMTHRPEQPVAHATLVGVSVAIVLVLLLEGVHWVRAGFHHDS